MGEESGVVQNTENTNKSPENGDANDSQIEKPRRMKKSRRHRSSVLDGGTLPLTEETLMATSDSSTLKRSKDRRKSVKERKSSKIQHDALARSRTRELDLDMSLEMAEDE